MILSEEFGETAKACYDTHYAKNPIARRRHEDQIIQEAAQTAAMAVRLIEGIRDSRK